MRFATWLLLLSTSSVAPLTLGCDGGDGDEGAGGHAPGGDGGVGFLNLSDGGVPQPPDGPASCPTNGACNYQTNEGCGAGQSCLPVPGAGGVAPACNAAGTKQPGEACTDVAECTAGHVCAEGACRKLCCGGDWTGCDSADEHCIKNLAYSTGETGAMLCYPVNTCDALAPASCDKAGETCQIVDLTGATACLPEGTGAAGEACPCKGGFLCKPKTMKCARLCGEKGPNCPEGEGTCVHYDEHPAGVGECVAGP